LPSATYAKEGAFSVGAFAGVSGNGAAAAGAGADSAAIFFLNVEQDEVKRIAKVRMSKQQMDRMNFSFKHDMEWLLSDFSFRLTSYKF
jgi:hypothetical protein